MRAGELPHITADILTRLRARAPRVHCITNAVAQTFTANVLLAAGAVPSMTLVGRRDRRVRGARRRAAGQSRHVRRGAARRDRGRARSRGRARACRGCSIRCSSTAPSRAPPMRSRSSRRSRARSGSTQPSSPRSAGRSRTMRRWRATRSTRSPVVALTGTVDRITDGAQRVAIENGHPLMARVTAMGCAASALTAAFLARRERCVRGDRGGAAVLRRRGRDRGRARERAGQLSGGAHRCALCARRAHADGEGEGDMKSMSASTPSSIRSARTAARSPS